MSAICGVSQKIKTREVHKQDKREESKMTNKEKKGFECNKGWTNDEISLLIDTLEANPYL